MGNKVTIQSLEKRLDGWSIYGSVEEGFELSGYSPAGENIILDLHGKTLDEMADYLEQYFESFDPDDHAAQIYHEKHYGTEDMQRFYASAPDDLTDLLDDTHAIEDMISDVIGRLRFVAKKSRTHDKRRRNK